MNGSRCSCEEMIRVSSFTAIMVETLASPSRPGLIVFHIFLLDTVAAKCPRWRR